MSPQTLYAGRCQGPIVPAIGLRLLMPALLAFLLCVWGPVASAFSVGPLAGINCINFILIPSNQLPSCTAAGVLGNTNRASFYVENHEIITNTGLAAVTYVPPAGTGLAQTAVTFDALIEIDIASADAEVDRDQTNHELHFDDEFLTQGSDRVIRGRERIIGVLNQPITIDEPTAVALRELLGGLLHTVQDFYAHSTWVRSAGAGQLPLFVTGNTPEPSPGQNVAFCNPVAPSVILFPGLTSGYADGKTGLLFALAPPGKCAHGFFLNGIHNDWEGRDFFEPAKAGAIQATTAYVNAIIFDAGNHPDSLCMLMTDAPCPTQTLSAHLHATGIEGSSIVGAVCPPGLEFDGYSECGFTGSDAAAGWIKQKFYASLSGLVVNFASCGFSGSHSQALAVAQSGSILVEGADANFGLPVCLLTSTAPLADGTPQFTASALSFHARGINSSGTIVGAACSNGQRFSGYAECASGGTPVAAASINGTYVPTLSSLVVNYAACGFSGPQSQALAVAEDGSILLEGSDGSRGLPVCLLTPDAPLADGTPQLRAAALTFHGKGINSSGTIVGAVCPPGQPFDGYSECGFMPTDTAAAIIDHQFYPSLSSLVVSFASCGFKDSHSQALAVSEDGSILVEGSDGAGLPVCLLTPTTPLANGTPQFEATPL